MNTFLTSVPEAKVQHVIDDMTQDVDWIIGRPNAEQVAHTATTLLLDELVDCPRHVYVSNRELSHVVDVVCPLLRVDYDDVMLHALCQLYRAKPPMCN